MFKKEIKDFKLKFVIALDCLSCLCCGDGDTF